MVRDIGIPEFARELARVAPEIVVFAGAGVSRDAPAFAPVFVELRAMLLQGLIDGLPGNDATLANDVFQVLSRNGRWYDLKPEVFFQCLHDFVGGELFVALEILRLGRPNQNHKQLCELSANGMGVIVTTNFEDYFEQAQPQAKVLHNGDRILEELAASGWRHQLSTVRSAARELLVWHLHGSLMRPETLQITLEEVARSVRSSALERSLAALVADLPVLVVGYSGRDDDVFPLLARMGVSGRGRGLFWLAHSERDISEGPVGRLIENWGSRAHLAVGPLAKVFAAQPHLGLRTSEPASATSLPHDLQTECSKRLAEWGRRIAAEKCWRLLGRFCWNLSDHRSAETCLLRAHDHYSRQDNVRGVGYVAGELGSVLLGMGKYEEAEAQFTRALEAHQNLGDEDALATGYHELSRVAQARGDLETALQHAEKARAIRARRGSDQQMASSAHALGSIYLQLGDFDLAQAHFEQAIQLREMTGDRFGLGDAHHELGRVYQMQDRIDMAADHYEKALATKMDLALPRGYAPTLFKLGEIALYRGDAAAARANYENCLAIYEAEDNPVGTAECINNLATVYISEKRWAEATELLNRARDILENLNLEAPLVGVYFNLGHAALGQEDLNSAMAAAVRSVELARGRRETDWTARATGLLGLVHSRRGNHAEARPLLTESWKLFEKFRQTSGSWAQAVRTALDETSSPGEGIGWIKRLLSHCSTLESRQQRRTKKDSNQQAGELWAQGQLFVQLERYEEALGLYDQALGLAPNAARIWYAKGNVLRNWRSKIPSPANARHDEAIACYQSAIDLDPGFADAWGNMGVCYGALDDPEKALACFMSALELRPFDRHWLQMRETALQKLGRG